MARLFALPPWSNSIAVEEVLKASESRHVFGHAAGFPEHEQ
jgi:hypothetical protein